MQSKETDDVVGLVRRVRKKFYAYKVCLAEYEEDERKEQAEDEELKTPSKSPKLPEVKKKKGVPPAIASLTAPQRIRDEIKNLCKLLHNIPAVKENELAFVHADIPKILEEVLMDEVAGVAVKKP